MDLTLHDGSIVSFTAAELAQSLTRLVNTNQSYCLGIRTLLMSASVLTSSSWMSGGLWAGSS